MTELKQILSLLPPLLSLAGLLLFFCDIPGIRPCHCPLFTVSIVTLAVYVSGTAGLLREGVYLTTLAGIIALVFEVYRTASGKFFPTRVILSPGVVAFALLGGYFFIRMSGVLLLHVDNFSHWGIIAREMCLTDSFPTEGTAVTFLNYTPGSASFIYYICKFTGYSEGYALAAQGLILAACIAVFFGDIRWREWLSLLSVAAVSVLVLSIPELDAASLHIYNLTVDGLVGILTAACLIVAYATKNSLPQALLTLTPMTALLSAVKTSGRIFTVMVIVAVVIMFAGRIFSRGWYKRRGSYFAAGSIVLSCALSLTSPVLYNNYICRTFSKEILDSCKFPSSAGDAMGLISRSDTDFLKNTARNVTRAVFDPSSPYTSVIIASLICTLLVLVIGKISGKGYRSPLLSIIAATVVFLIYSAELYVLYLFIFPKWEAEILASFYRYFSTGAVVVSALLLLGAVYGIRKILGSVPVQKITIAATALLLIPFSVLGDRLPQLVFRDIRGDVSQRIALREGYHAFYSSLSDKIPAGARVAVFTSDISYFAAALPAYELMTCAYSVTTPDDISDTDTVKEQLMKADFLVLCDTKTDFSSCFTAENVVFPQKPGVYEILHGERIFFIIDTEG